MCVYINVPGIAGFMRLGIDQASRIHFLMPLTEILQQCEMLPESRC
jgi:hypothetical protein